MNAPAKFPAVAASVVGLAALIGLLFPQPCAGQSQQKPTSKPEAAPQMDAKALEVLRQAAEHLRRLKALTADLRLTINMQMRGIKQEMPMDYSLAVQRPNQFALVLKSGVVGATVVSDGKKLYTYMPLLKRYTEAEAPGDLSGLSQAGGSAASVSSGLGAGALVSALFAEDPEKALLEGVKLANYLGTEEVEKRPCHHLRFSQDEVDWELWLEAGQQPWVRKVFLDLGKAMESQLGNLGEQLGEAGGMAELFKDLKMTMTLSFTDWTAHTELPADRFRFTPPEGAKKGDSLVGELAAGQEEPHELLGQPAPTFKLDLLDGGQLDLAALKGQKVVILDFWATWCGPCVRALPILTEVAEAYKDKGVVLFGVNQAEKEETIRAFLKKRNLKLTVALDRDGEVGRLYGVEGIPQTVLIDKRGIVQAVHVGLLPNLKAKLSEELDAILAGKNLAEAKAKPADTFKLEHLELAWTIEGRWVGVAAGTSPGVAYALGRGGKLIELDATGKTRRELPFGSQGARLRLANLVGDKAYEFVSFDVWGRSVTATDERGQILWSYNEGQGVDDVWTADLDGNGLDEVIIGYNGTTGLHVLDNRGKPLWTYTRIANVWHVCAGDVTGDGIPEVVTTSARGQVHVFDAEGRKLKDLELGPYANLVRLAKATPADRAACIVAGGREKEEAVLIGLNAEGQPQWRLKLGPDSTASIECAAAAPDRPWLAVGLRAEGVKVIDVAKGTVIAQATGLKMPRGDMAWLARGPNETPLLLVATGKDLKAFRVSPTH